MLAPTGVEWTTHLGQLRKMRLNYGIQPKSQLIKISSPTREIYNDKDELMWHNAELVNGGEIITQSIRSISENLSLIMEGEPELFRGGDIAFSTARRVMEMLGWKCSYAGKATLGQDAYYCIICTKPDKDFKYKIFGNAYEGSISISKEKL